MTSREFWFGFFGLLIGATVTALVFLAIEAKSPVTMFKTACNDGWHIEEKDGKIVETYMPELDTCKRR